MIIHRTAVYPGTFDPITNGHTDLLTRAARVFSRSRHCRDRRKSLTRSPCSAWKSGSTHGAGIRWPDLENVEVVGFSNLLVEFVQQIGAACHHSRGLRAVSDFEYEFQLASMNRHHGPGRSRHLFLTPDEDYSFISSSLW